MKIQLVLQLALIPVILILWAVYVCSYVVEETDQVIITEFGKPIGKPVTEAGLYFKTPFIQEINRIEKRFLPWDGPSNEMSTKDPINITAEDLEKLEKMETSNIAHIDCKWIQIFQLMICIFHYLLYL